MAGTVHGPALTTLRTCHRATVWPSSSAIAALVRRDRPANSYTSAISSRYCSLAIMTTCCHDGNMLSILKVSASLPSGWLACRVAKEGETMNMPAEATRPDNGLIDALHVSGPAHEHADKLMLFGQFVGSWDVEWAATGANGEPATATGELHFGWVLGGRAVQDIWIVPGRG